MSTKTVRNVREPLKKPRPLKSTSSSDQLKFHVQDPKDTVTQKSRADILADLEILNVSISNCNFDEVTAADISRMCTILKKRGEELDCVHKDALDRYFCTLRNASREDKLDIISRLKLLEVIEMRAMHWKMNENLSNYFNAKFVELEQSNERLNASGAISPNILYTSQSQHAPIASTASLASGEILRSSGKFAKPTKIIGKNYFKDEIVIRNSDSGKVNPGARDRLVQITGPHEEAIGHAKLLVEDTIRRNASPVRENADALDLELDKEHLEYDSTYVTTESQPHVKKSLPHSHSMGDASLREFCIPVFIGQDVINLSGAKLELLKTAKLVLASYFAGQTEVVEKQYDNLLSSNLQSPMENNMQRFELKRQISLKDNMPVSFPLTLPEQTSKRDSLSPFSSSDDDFIKDDKSGKNEKVQNLISPVSPSSEKRNKISTKNSSEQDKFIRSFSAPNESTVFENFIEVPELISKKEMTPLLSSSDGEVPPIPPPSYQRQSYTREFLLNCSNLPLSHNQPANYAHIRQNFQEIIRQSPIMFDPSKYQVSEAKVEGTYNMLK